MAELNFNLLRQEGPKNLYEGFEQGRQAAAQNALAQQETAQKREFDTLRKQQIVSQMRASEQTQNRELVTQRTQQYRDRLLRAGTPDAVRNLIRQRHADPILGPATLAFGSLDDDLAEVPDDVTAFQDYLSREAMGAAEFIKFTQEGRSISQIMGGGGGAAAPAAAPAPAAPSQMNLPAGVQPETMGRVPGVVTSPVLDATPMNAMMPAPMTAAPPAQVNALRPPAAGPDVAEMRRQRDGLLLMGGPRAKALADKLQLDITAATTATPADIKTMEALGFPITQAGFTAFRNAYRQDRLLTPEEEAQKARIAQAGRAPAAPRPEPAPRTQQVTMSDGTLGIVNMDTGVITPSTVDGVPVKGKANKDLAVSEQQASYNLGRILDAAKEINAALKKDPNALKPGMGEASAASVGLSGTANVARSAQRQIVYGAQRDALDAMLYLATGAAYNKEQLDGQMAAYVPAFTDKPDAVEAKRVRMLGLIQNAKVRAGKAWTPEMDAASQALLLPVASSAKPAGGNKPPAAPGASNVTQDRADANAAIAAGAPADAVRARFKQRTGQEL